MMPTKPNVIIIGFVEGELYFDLPSFIIVASTIDTFLSSADPRLSTNSL